MEYMNINYMFT